MGGAVTMKAWPLKADIGVAESGIEPPPPPKNRNKVVQGVA